VATKNSEYWRNRFEALEQVGYRQGSDIVKQAERIYSVADRELQMEMMLWYQRIAANNGVSMFEARKMLSAEELEEFKWTVEDYIKYGEKNGISGDWSKELENASAKAHIDRLTAMRMSARNAVENLGGKLEKTVTNGLGDVYKESTYRTGYEIQKGKGKFEPFGRVNENQLSEALKKPWTEDGKTFADRLNRDKKKLVKAVDDTITKGIIKGSTVDEMTAELSKRTTESLRSARTIIRTETSSIAIRAELSAYNNLDVEKIEISETLDTTTCPQCGSLDGTVIAIKDARVGENVPPFHPRCRGCTVPYFDDDFFPDTTRAARNPETGKTEYVEDMNYSQWKEKYVDKSYSMAATGRVDWSGTTPISHTKEDIKELKEFAKDYNMQIFNEKLFDGDIDILKEQITSIRNTLNDYKITDKITISFAKMEDDDFAETTGSGTITFNPKALRNREYTNKILNADNDLASTDVSGIGVHECGHIISRKYGEKGLEIAKKAYYNVHKEEISDRDALMYLRDNVSLYSAHKDESKIDKPFKAKYCKEIVPEVLAKDATNKDEFTQEFARLLRGQML
jgi:SPP1 gp7 family putative phage head morphogenesis protein